MRTLFQKIGKIEFQSYDKCDLDMAMAAVTNKNMSLVPKGYEYSIRIGIGKKITTHSYFLQGISIITRYFPIWSIKESYLQWIEHCK